MSLDRIKKILKINEATVKVSFNLVDLENAVLKCENGILSPENLIGYLRKEMENALQKRQVRDEEKSLREQEIEKIRTHARMLFADGFVSLGYDTDDESVVSMVESLANHYVHLKSQHGNLEDNELTKQSIVNTQHISSKEWRIILDKLKSYLQGEGRSSKVEE